MIEIIQKNYFIILYSIALVFSIVRYRYYYESPLKFFPIIIAYTLLNEILGGLIKHIDIFQIIYIDLEQHSQYNKLIYNIFDIIFFLYFFYVFWRSMHKEIHKNYVKYGAVLFSVISIVNISFEDIFLSTPMYCIFSGSLILLGITILYLKQVQKATRIIKSRYNILMLWICIGFLIFYPFYPFLVYIIENDPQIYYEYHILTILHILIVCMYTCFILGFLRMTKGRIAQ
ncbi:hypothetical protein [Spongiimicrobium salis]|uniref:hypothetical protein n=1 Tax=Spongiimicrobium salis TaxID=1667022 RepID=UPI00374DCBC5